MTAPRLSKRRYFLYGKIFLRVQLSRYNKAFTAIAPVRPFGRRHRSHGFAQTLVRYNSRTTMAPTTRSISVNVSSTSSAEDSQGSAQMSNNCVIALALLLIATGMLALLAHVDSPSSPSLSSSATFHFLPGPSVVSPLPSSPTQQSPPGYLQGTIRVAGGYYMIESGSCGGGTILTTSECDAAATALGLPDKTSTDIKRQTASLIPRGCVFLRSFLYVIRRGSSSASCTSSRQCICTFTPPSPPPSPPSQLPPPPPPHAAAHATAHAAANAATRPKESPVPKVSTLPPSSQSPSGATRLIHTATLEPVCIGRAHTLTVDKAMVINFKSIIHEDEDDEDEDEEEDEEEDDEATEKFKPATALVLPTLTCVWPYCQLPHLHSHSPPRKATERAAFPASCTAPTAPDGAC